MEYKCKFRSGDEKKKKEKGKKGKKKKNGKQTKNRTKKKTKQKTTQKTRRPCSSLDLTDPNFAFGRIFLQFC